MGLRLRPDLAHHPVPFMVGQASGVFPAFDLALERGVGPQMMAVRGEMEPVGSGSRGSSRKSGLKLKVRSSATISSGKARLVRVEAR